MNQKVLLSLIKQAKEREAKILALGYQPHLVELSISNLVRPSYHKRVVVDTKLKTIVDSLSEYGFFGGIFVNEQTNEIVDGWYRSQIWKQLGNSTVPAYLLTIQNRKQEFEVHLRLNQSHATFLADDFGLEYEGVDLRDLGFTEADLHKPQITPEKHTQPSRASKKEGYTKFSTNIPVAIFERLKAVKIKFMLHDWVDVLEILIENHEKHSN
jgi:hypothetical protein